MLLVELTFHQELAVQFISFLGALVVGLLVVFITKRLENKKERQRELDLLNFVSVSIQMNLESIKVQYKEIESFLAKLEKKNDIDYYLKLTTNLDFAEWIKGLDMLSFKSAFFKHFHYKHLNNKWNAQNKIHYFNLLFKQILHITKIVEQIPISFEKGIEEVNKFEELYNQSRGRIEELKAECIKVIEEAHNSSLHIFENDVLRVFIPYHHKVRNPRIRNSIKVWHTRIVAPLHEVFINHKRYDLVHVLADCNFAFESLEKSKRFTYNRFNSYRKSLMAAYNDLSEIVTRLNEDKNIYPWKYKKFPILDSPLERNEKISEPAAV